MGVKGDFFARAAPACRFVRLKDLAKIGALAVAGIDASIWEHQLARCADVFAWLDGEYQSAIDRFLLRLYKLRRHGPCWRARRTVCCSSTL